jgi:hypothetical protein
MLFPSAVAAIGLAALTAAKPTPTKFELAPRCGITVLPTFYQQIEADNAGQSYAPSNEFLASQSSNAASNIATLVQFENIPAGSYGCDLSVSFTYQYPINSSGSTLLNVYPLPGPVSSSDNYSTYFPNGGKQNPKGAPLWGSVTLDGNRHDIGGSGCTANPAFLFEIASDTQAGSVAFADAGNNLSGIGGFYITYDC